MSENRTRRHQTNRSKTNPRSNLSRHLDHDNSGRPPRFISFLTDFGLTDAYVGVMKGVVASINPDARVIDICHDVAPQDVRAAAFLLASSYAYFPPGTIHVAVVDPTVGSSRAALCVQAGDYFFIGPDNGVVSTACYKAGRPRIHRLENEEYFLKNRSRTFHGRDIFAPAAAHLSAGVPIESMGQRLRSMKRIRLPRPVIRHGSKRNEQWVRGEIIHVDRFGNLITNIEPETLKKAFPRRKHNTLDIVCSGHTIRGVSKTYSDVLPGRALALVGSYGLIEISVRDRNAASSLGVERGEKVKIGLEP